jgi:Na+/proline symporter
MPPVLTISIIAIYFLLLVVIARFTSGKGDNATFFTGNRNSSWYVVAFGMIGASLSGVTFISVPGWVEGSGFSYMQMVLGYMIGYVIIAFVLLPLYYRHNLSSIYTYLGERFGPNTHLTGTVFFLFSRILGSSFRLFLVADVLHYFVFSQWDIPFWSTVAITLFLIWLYTNRGGIKTIIWTDTLQTFFMLTALVVAILFISDYVSIADSQLYEKISITNWFVTDNYNVGNYWWKHVLGGMFVSLAMTGMDQDMMQKNLTCKNANDAKKNILSLGVILILVNFVFLLLGAYLYTYVQEFPDLLTELSGMKDAERGDRLFPLIAFKGGLGLTFSILFILGLIAAAYSSADSALTALTTSASVDIFKVNRMADVKKAERTRKRVHIGMSLIILLTILLAAEFKEQNVIGTIFSAANYTYGPLLGLFMFGIISKRKINDRFAWLVCLIVPALMYAMKTYEAHLFGDYKFGYELLGINGILCYFGLFMLSKTNVSGTTFNVIEAAPDTLNPSKTEALT